MSQREHVSIARPLQRSQASEPTEQRRRGGASFSDEVRADRRRERARTGLSVGGGLVAALVGGPVAVAARAIQSSTGGAASAGTDIDSMWDRQAESREFNEEYLALQQQMQADNQQFSALSNLMKARHDTARAAISNMRV